MIFETSFFQSTRMVTLQQKFTRDFNRRLDLRRIERCCRMICQSGSITVSSSPGCPRLIRTKTNIRKVKHRLRPKTRISVSARRLSIEFDISQMNVR